MQESTIEYGHARQVVTGLALVVLLLFGGHAAAEIASDIEVALGGAEVSVEAIEPLDPKQLDTLVAPIALYPDDLVGLVLPASTYPLQVVQAARFLEARAADDGLQPDPEWDDSIVALLNYPEVLELMDDDLDWTWRLGEAVLLQQAEVIDAVAEFRERARLAGNLESDEHQTVEVNDDGVIEIDPANPEELYIPYYEPEEVTVYQRDRVYHYYPRAYPVYYYPYPSDYYFPYYFWGVTSFYSVGWNTHHLHLHHYGFNDHPYFGHYYYDPFYHRQPHLWLSLNYYDDRHRYRHHGSHHQGNYWYGNRHHRGAGPADRRHEQHRARADHDQADRRRQRRLASLETFEGKPEQTIRHRRSGRSRDRQDNPALASNRATSTRTATPTVEQTTRRRNTRQRPGNEVTQTRGDRPSERVADVQPRERATRTTRVRAERNDRRRPRVATTPRRVAESTAALTASQPRQVRAQPRVAEAQRRSAPTPPRTERRSQLANEKAAPRAQPSRAQPSRSKQERAQPRRPANVTQQRPQQVARQSAPRSVQRESRSQPPSHGRSQSRSVSRSSHRSQHSPRANRSVGFRRHD